MTDLSPELKSALAHLDVTWDQEREDQTWQGLRVKRTRRAVVRASAATVAVLLAAGGAWYWQQGRAGGDPSRLAERPQPAPQVAPQIAPQRAPEPEVSALAVRLDDGSLITPADDGSAVEVVADTRARVEVKVVRGKSDFRVTREPQREFAVDAGEVKIAVYSSQFSVARFDDRTEVSAVDGYLKIEWSGKVQEVRAGETAKFPPVGALDAPPADPRMDAPTRRTRSPREQVEDLMHAADIARARQQPSDAVAPLERVIDKYSRDSRAPLAAFTLGRVLLDDLGRPEAAARAFRKARDLAPRGALAEDALAREAEAWAQAGNGDRARERADQYLEKYPDGHRVPAMRQLVE